MGTPDEGEDKERREIVLFSALRQVGEDREIREIVLFLIPHTRREDKEGRLYCSWSPTQGGKTKKGDCIVLGPQPDKGKDRE